MLLNCYYKIAAKAVAGRIKTFLPKLVSDDQTPLLEKQHAGSALFS